MPSKTGPAKQPSPIGGMTTEQLATLLRELVLSSEKRMQEFVAKRLDERLLLVADEVGDVVEEIHKRLDGALFFKGVWEPAGEYRKNSLVQHGGTCWVSTAEKATTKPGTSSEWRLLVKSAKGQRHNDGE